MVDSRKGKEKAIVGESATDDPTSGLGSADVAPQSAATASISPAEAPVAPTELPSETVKGPASTAELVNPLVLVVSISKHFLLSA
jgi:hypothetical protein